MRVDELLFGAMDDTVRLVFGERLRGSERERIIQATSIKCSCSSCGENTGRHRSIFQFLMNSEKVQAFDSFFERGEFGMQLML